MNLNHNYHHESSSHLKLYFFGFNHIIKVVEFNTKSRKNELNN